MELNGKVIQILPLQTGMGKKGQWKKQEFVLETQTQYPKKVCFTAWGDKIVNLAIGAAVTVSVDLESREYNGRWYTEARAYKIERSATHTTTAPPAQASPQRMPASTDDLPF